MRKPAVKLVVFLGVVAIIGIIAMQVYFFQIAFNNEERKLNQKIQVALWNVVEQIYELAEIQYVGEDPVVQITQDYFVVNVKDFIEAEILEHYLKRNFEKQNINLDFEYAIYDCQSDEMIYGNYVSMSEKEDRLSNIVLEKHEDFVYYFGIYFPSREQYILGSINSIYLLSGILIFVVLFLGYALTVILQQKRFSDLQKSIVNNLTHEFKTPLSSIALSADVLNEDSIVKEPERIKAYSQIIKNQANSLLNHTEQVLGMSEIENTGRLNKKNVNLHELLCNLLDNESWRTRKKQVNFSIELKAKDYTVCADEFHLTNLIVNLVDNAIKYSGDNLDLQIRTDSNKKNIHLSIEDNGIGIDKKYRKKIFKKFFRIPTGNVHNVKGFGLGLSYVQDVIRGHRWKLKLESEVNRGTRFIITIPLKDVDCE